MPIKPSELILNTDGSVYHLGLLPQDIANTIITVGDQERVGKITEHFDSIELTKQIREFKTQTGTYKGKRITVISTGIGPDNVDIVLNELDALVNINLNTREVKPNLTALNIIRIGTSGTLQGGIPVNSFLLSSYGLNLNATLHAYQTQAISNADIENAFVSQTQYSNKKAWPIVVKASDDLFSKFNTNSFFSGITATANGFYGPQGRSLRLPLQNPDLMPKMANFEYHNLKITNLEMETAAIYGLSRLLGHNAISLNAILANRITGEFSSNPSKTINELIEFALERIVKT